MNRQEIFNLIRKKKSFLCIGLDSEYSKLPSHLLNLEDPVFEFNKQIIDATKDITVAYKPNLAFYESLGQKGWVGLEKTIKYLNALEKEVFTIADAKRGDIGNTSRLYAKAFFEQLNFDAITVAPYMGKDSVSPFLTYEGKWAILLALTSNTGSDDFQMLQPQLPTTLEKMGIKTRYWKKLYEIVISKSFEWGNEENIMFVVGATKAEMIADIRELAPNHFLLVPGVGAQGGSLENVAKYGLNKQCGLLVNASRSIIFASSGEDFAIKAREEALKMQSDMQRILSSAGLL